MSGTEEQRVKVTIETEIDEATAAIFYDLYRHAFGDLEKRAVARQLLHREEFFEEMHDPRVRKYVAWSDDGEPIGMSTFTNQLETVPWISPAYFEHHYPEAFARGAIYYVGFSLVRRTERRGRVFEEMVRRMAEGLADKRAVVGWDVCAFNDEEGGLSFGEMATRLLNREDDVAVERIDRQTYYVGTFQPRREA
jgi:hypothetical protein